MKNKLITFALIVFSAISCNHAIADEVRLNVGASVINSALGNRSMSIKQDTNLAPSVGLSYFASDMIYSFNTNRIFNNSIDGVALQYSNNRAYSTKTKNFTDAVSVGKFFTKNCVLSIFLAQNKSKTDFFLGKTKKFSQSETSYLTGLSASYFFNKNVSASVLYAEPIRSKVINRAYGTSINYYF